jgi:hypothetical protein
MNSDGVLASPASRALFRQGDLKIVRNSGWVASAP